MARELSPDGWSEHDTEQYAAELADTDAGWHLTEEERSRIRQSTSFAEINSISVNAALRVMGCGGKPPVLEEILTESHISPDEPKKEKAAARTIANLKMMAGTAIMSTAGSALIHDSNEGGLTFRTAALAVLTGLGLGLTISGYNDLQDKL